MSHKAKQDKKRTLLMLDTDTGQGVVTFIWITR